jgi:hypothetical protein
LWSSQVTANRVVIGATTRGKPGVAARFVMGVAGAFGGAVAGVTIFFLIYGLVWLNRQGWQVQ